MRVKLKCQIFVPALVKLCRLPITQGGGGGKNVSAGKNRAGSVNELNQVIGSLPAGRGIGF